MKISILTLFPAPVRAYLGESILKIAAEKGKVGYEVIDIRDFAEGKHRQVDDRPFGGGPGMVLMPGPVVAAAEKAREGHEAGAPTLLLSPQGERFDQDLAEELAQRPGIVLVCGRYEGFDDRIRDVLDAREISMGDYVLAGGEIPALAVTEAVVRLLPGVLREVSRPREHGEGRGEAPGVVGLLGLLVGPLRVGEGHGRRVLGGGAAEQERESCGEARGHSALSSFSAGGLANASTRASKPSCFSRGAGSTGGSSPSFGGSSRFGR